MYFMKGQILQKDFFIKLLAFYSNKTPKEKNHEKYKMFRNIVLLLLNTIIEKKHSS